MTQETIRYVETLHFIGTVLGACLLGALLLLQYKAFRRHRSRSFALLVASSCLGFGYLGASSAARFYPSHVSSLHTLGFVLFCLHGSLGLFGAIGLFADYRRLAEVAPASEPLSTGATAPGPLTPASARDTSAARTPSPPPNR